MQTFYDKIKKTTEDVEKTWHEQLCEAELDQFAEIQQSERSWEYWND